jgi:hypothetical protein
MVAPDTEVLSVRKEELKERESLQSEQPEVRRVFKRVPQENMN